MGDVRPDPPTAPHLPLSPDVRPDPPTAPHPGSALLRLTSRPPARRRQFRPKPLLPRHCPIEIRTISLENRRIHDCLVALRVLDVGSYCIDPCLFLLFKKTGGIA